MDEGDIFDGEPKEYPYAHQREIYEEAKREGYLVIPDVKTEPVFSAYREYCVEQHRPFVAILTYHDHVSIHAYIDYTGFKLSEEGKDRVCALMERYDARGREGGRAPLTALGSEYGIVLFGVPNQLGHHIAVELLGLLSVYRIET